MKMRLKTIILILVIALALNDIQISYSIKLTEQQKQNLTDMTIKVCNDPVLKLKSIIEHNQFNSNCDRILTAITEEIENSTNITSNASD